MNTTGGVDAYDKALRIAVDDAFDVAFAMSSERVEKVLRDMVNKIVDEVLVCRGHAAKRSKRAARRARTLALRVDAGAVTAFLAWLNTLPLPDPECVLRDAAAKSKRK